MEIHYPSYKEINKLVFKFFMTLDRIYRFLQLPLLIPCTQQFPVSSKCLALETSEFANTSLRCP